MWIRALRHIPNVGGPSTVRNIDERSARCLLALGWAERTENPNAPKPKRIYTRKVEEPQIEQKPKRTYKRKDIVPEPELVAEEPQPKTEPEASEPDEADAPVRL